MIKDHLIILTEFNDTDSFTMFYVTLGSKLADIKTDRASVIPYTICRSKTGREEISFLLARDKKTGDITDFGGGVKKNENSLSGGLREFQEESNEIFGPSLYDANNLGLSVALVNKTMSALFLPVSFDNWYTIAPDLFRKKTRRIGNGHDEISEIMWYNEKEFERLIFPYTQSYIPNIRNFKRRDKMWSVIKKFYGRGYSDLLRNALSIAYHNNLMWM